MTIDWPPSCSLELLQLRAAVLRSIRLYFYEQEVLEVETPILCQSIGTDPYLDFFTTDFAATPYYLQTSPEFSMKRLLAGGAGSCYQITKSFRQGEAGRYHNPEFTLLEWYRVGFNLSDLMGDVENLLCPLLKNTRFNGAVERYAYVDVFQKYTGLNSLQFSLPAYQAVAEKFNCFDAYQLCGEDHSLWLDFLFSICVQNELGKNGVCMIYHYPACLPSLARLNEANDLLSERVEIFVNGIEMGNGYFELADAVEQEQRFEREIELRKQNKSILVSKDARFLAALNSGLPDCAGLAIGLDRLLMVLSGKEKITEVLAFPIENA